MNCPFCGEPMEAGVVHGSRVTGVPWLPEGSGKTPLWTFNELFVKKHHGVYLGTFRGLREGYQLNFSICRACKKGVADLSENL